MKLHFTDQTFSFELVPAVSYGPYGGSEIGNMALLHQALFDWLDETLKRKQI